MTSDSSGHVTACIPYFRCKSHVRRAVLCLLTQTHRELTVVVLNDGDPDPPWDVLADISDPRLVRFNLPKNRGPYFALETCLRATKAPYFLIQDADDWSDRRRVASLLHRMKDQNSDYATSAQAQYRLQPDGRVSFCFLKWSRPPEPSVKPDFEHRICHHGLFQTRSLLMIGGYYGGFRVGFDMLVMNLLLMTGRVSHVPEPLYHRVIREDSLSHSDSKTQQSRYVIERIIPFLYNRAYEIYRAHQFGRLSSAQLYSAFRSISATYVTEADREALKETAAQLSGRLSSARRFPAQSSAGHSLARS